MADDTLDYEMDTPAPPAAIAQSIEDGWIETAMGSGAATAYAKKTGAKWHFVAEFASDALEGYGHFCKLMNVPGLPPVNVKVKKAGRA